MTDDLSHPSELRLTGDGDRLEIAWSDGGRGAIPADRLRAASRSAGAVKAQQVEGRPCRSTGVTITDLEMVGAYAVRVFFSDGHDRGIYPWRYLRELAAV